MATSHYERLSALDATFLEVEDHNAHMHVGAVSLFDAAAQAQALYRNQALGIALFSYNNGLFWGFNADWDAVPDLHELVEAIGTEFEHLRAAAAAGADRSSEGEGASQAPTAPDGGAARTT